MSHSQHHGCRAGGCGVCRPWKAAKSNSLAHQTPAGRRAHEDYKSQLIEAGRIVNPTPRKKPVEDEHPVTLAAVGHAIAARGGRGGRAPEDFDGWELCGRLRFFGTSTFAAKHAGRGGGWLLFVPRVSEAGFSVSSYKTLRDIIAEQGKPSSFAPTVDAVKAAIKGSGNVAIPFFHQRDPDHLRWSLVTESAREPGRWQWTRFDAAGPVGHVCFDVIGDALDEALREGWRPAQVEGPGKKRAAFELEQALQRDKTRRAGIRAVLGTLGVTK